MEPVKNYNISVYDFALMNKEEREEFDRYMESINCTYTITE